MMCRGPEMMEAINSFIFLNQLTKKFIQQSCVAEQCNIKELYATRGPKLLDVSISLNNRQEQLQVEDW